MQMLEDVADKLALEALDAEERLGDEKVISQVAAAIANSSPTMEEVFQMAVRVRRAERRARALLHSLSPEGAGGS